MKKQFSKSVLFSLIAPACLLLAYCGGDGGGSEEGGAGAGTAANIIGSITSQFGGQGELAGWVIASVSKPTNVSRVSDIDAAGLYTLKNLDTGRPQTLVLLSPDFIYQSSLSMPGIIENTVRQYFRPNTAILPPLIHKGQVISFQNLDSLTVENDLAVDVDANGTPDGAASVMLRRNRGRNLTTTQLVDLDLDGIINDEDPDIDGDGISNVFDPDDDGDAVIDLVDQDANGNLIIDVNEKLSHSYFQEKIEWFVARFEMVAQADATNKTYLSFTTKLRPETTPISVGIRGSLALFNNPVLEIDGATQAWDGLLLDDGLNADGAALDGLFARKVLLENAKTPRAHQVVFLRLGFGDPLDPWFIEFPYTFPNVVPAMVTTQYDAAARTVQLVGNPFGEIQGFVWAVSVYNAENQKIYTSPPTDGAQRSVVLPTNIFEAGAVYTYSAVAQVLEAVPGYSPFVIRSLRVNLE